MLGEAISFALAKHMPRAKAKEVIRQVIQRAFAEDRHVIDVLRETFDA